MFCFWKDSAVVFKENPTKEPKNLVLKGAMTLKRTHLNLPENWFTNWFYGGHIISFLDWNYATELKLHICKGQNI